jgi:hypothetical protein
MLLSQPNLTRSLSSIAIAAVVQQQMKALGRALQSLPPLCTLELHLAVANPDQHTQTLRQHGVALLTQLSALDDLSCAFSRGSARLLSLQNPFLESFLPRNGSATRPHGSHSRGISRCFRCCPRAWYRG